MIHRMDLWFFLSLYMFNSLENHLPILIWKSLLYSFKRTVARSHRNARRASRAQRMLQVNTPRVRNTFVENFKDAPRAQDNLSKLLTTLFAIVAPSAGTLQNLCTFLVRVPALGAAMLESAVSHLTRAWWRQWGRQRFSTNGRYGC